jgi:LacI family transcriptional regulator
MNKSILIQLTESQDSREYKTRNDLRHGILEKSIEHELKIIDLYFSNGVIPSDLTNIVGAIVRLLPDHPTVIKLIKEGIPVIRCGLFPHPLDHTIHTVLPNWGLTGQLAANHFLERGFLNFGVVCNGPEIGLEELYHSFQINIEENGSHCHYFHFDKSKAPSLENEEWMSQQFLDWLNEQPKPMGLFCGHEMTAYRLVSICMSLGISIPEDVVILCVSSDDLTCETMPISLSSIKLDRSAQAKAAVGMVSDISLDMIKAPEAVVCPPSMPVERRSTNSLIGSEPWIAKAIRFIWSNYRDPVSVDMVAKHVSVSRRKLEINFKKFLKRSVGEELKRKRLEEACYLLRSTSKKVHEISELCGMGGVISLNRNFKNTYSLTPIEYRKKHTQEDLK